MQTKLNSIPVITSQLLHMEVVLHFYLLRSIFCDDIRMSHYFSYPRQYTVLVQLFREIQTCGTQPAAVRVLSLTHGFDCSVVVLVDCIIFTELPAVFVCYFTAPFILYFYGLQEQFVQDYSGSIVIIFYK